MCTRNTAVSWEASFISDGPCRCSTFGLSRQVQPGSIKLDWKLNSERGLGVGEESFPVKERKPTWRSVTSVSCITYVVNISAYCKSWLH